MNLLISANNTYLSPLKIMLTSFCESNQNEHHHIYFLYGDVDEKELLSIGAYFEKHYDVTFTATKINTEDFKQFPISHHFSIETYYRFLVTDILPMEEDRVLWLDIDIIVKKSLYDFYYQDFQGNMIAACKSINKNPQTLLDQLGCPAGTVYFNAGVILFNLKLIRTKYTVDDFFSYYVSHKDRITWLDQDILNGVFALQTRIHDYHLYNYQMFNEECLQKSDLKFIETHTAIIHYIGAKKPWHSEYQNPCKKYWRKYTDIYKKKNNKIAFYGSLLLRPLDGLKKLSKLARRAIRAIRNRFLHKKDAS